MEPIVELKSLTKDFGKKRALDQITLQIPKGRIVGLLGPNGSGKTTLMKLLNGLIQPSSGEVLINNIKPGKESKKIVSYLPEQTYLNDWMKVKDIISFFGDFYEDFDPYKCRDLLKDLNVDISDKLKAMSKGTKEKVQLVLVMSRRAQLYLLDEPIGGVDPAARDYILNTIITNYDPTATVLISTHLIEDVERVLDEFIFLSQGKIVRQGTADQVREETGKSLDELFREVFKCLPNC